jgi:multiple sugar transport system permease protein
MQPITSRRGRFLVTVLLVFFFLYSTVPFIWTIMQSLKTNRQANARTPLLFFKPTLANYSEVWLNSTDGNTTAVLWGLIGVMVLLAFIGYLARYLPVRTNTIYWGIVGVVILTFWAIPRLLDTSEFYDYFLNSVIVSVGAVVISLTLSSLSGYALARYSGIAAVVILLTALAFRALPKMGFILPYYWMGQLSGLYDTRILVIITMVALNQPFSIWMLRGFFRDIPYEIEEAAMIDGANRLNAFVRVILPIAWPGLIATALFTLLLAYQEFLLVRILTQANTTLSVASAQFLGGRSVASSVALQSAAAVSATMPLVVVVLIFQKHLVRGLSAGAVKG